MCPGRRVELDTGVELLRVRVSSHLIKLVQSFTTVAYAKRHWRTCNEMQCAPAANREREWRNRPLRRLPRAATITRHSRPPGTTRTDSGVFSHRSRRLGRLVLAELSRTLYAAVKWFAAIQFRTGSRGFLHWTGCEVWQA